MSHNRARRKGAVKKEIGPPPRPGRDFTLLDTQMPSDLGARRQGQSSGASGRTHMPARSNQAALVCKHCGYRLADWMQLWIMQMHFEIWHDTEELSVLTIERGAKVDDFIDGEKCMEPQAVTEALAKLAAATKEARQATSDAHSATKALQHAVKDQGEAIKTQIAAAVAEAVGSIGDEAMALLVSKVDTLITDVGNEWRTRLGLTS